MKMRSAVLLALSAVGLMAVGGHAADSLEQVKQKGVLTVGVKFRVRPFGFVDPATGDLAGYDVDVAKAIAAKLGVKLQLRPVDQKSRLPELLEGNIDVIAANLVANPDTGKVIDFSDVYLITGQGFVAKKGTVKTLTDLGGKKIAVLAGTASEENAKTSLQSATIVSFSDYKKGIEALKTGAVDAASGDSSVLPALLPVLGHDEFEVTPVLIAEIPYVLGVRKGDTKLLEVVNQTVRDLEKSGEGQKLVDKWFKPAKPAAQTATGTAAADAPAAEAAGAIVRRATTPPSVVVVVLKGFFPKGSEVSVYTPKGDFFCKGKVTAVFAEQIYVDVDPTRYDGVNAGFAVGMNVNEAAVKGAIAKHQDVLKGVQEQSKKEEEAYVAQREKEAIEKEQRGIEADQKRFESKLRVEEERANNDNEYNWNVNRSHD